jgi:hypothetical protein
MGLISFVIPAKAGIHWFLSNKLQNGFPDEIGASPLEFIPTPSGRE